jgi:hypothetical protein
VDDGRLKSLHFATEFPQGRQIQQAAVFDNACVDTGVAKFVFQRPTTGGADMHVETVSLLSGGKLAHLTHGAAMVKAGDDVQYGWFRWHLFISR